MIDEKGARLPSLVRVLYRWENTDGSVAAESEPMRFVNGAMVARRESVQRPFSYRVEGGDDRSMPWRRVEVVEPAAVESFTITLIPPAYTGWPPRPSEGNIRALVGTRVEIAGTATKPLASLSLCLDSGREIAGTLGEDGRSFTVGRSGQPPFLVEKSGFYGFRLADPELDRPAADGPGEPRWEIKAIADNPPSIAIVLPPADIFVTPSAMVPLRMVAKDDLGLRSIELEFTVSGSKSASPGLSRSGATNEKEKPPEGRTPAAACTVRLYEGPKQTKSGPEALPAAGNSGETREASYDWSLGDLKLRPGTVVTFRGVATDYQPRSVKSEPRRLSIITPEDLADRLAARQAALLDELKRVLQLQRQSREQVVAVEILAREVGRLAQREIDRLRGAELSQRQVTQTLTSRTDGIPAQITALLADLTNNKIDSPDVQRRMQAVHAKIEQLAAGELAIVERSLTTTIKAGQIQWEGSAAQRPPIGKPNVAVADPLAETSKNQEKAIRALEQMLAELGRWGSFRRFHSDVGQLLREQQELNQSSRELGSRTLAKELKDLPPQDVADLRVASGKQLDYSLRLDFILQSMEQASTPCGKAIRWPRRPSPTRSSGPVNWVSAARCGRRPKNLAATASANRSPGSSRSWRISGKYSTFLPIAGSTSCRGC